jgi:hypothetical protein
MLCSVGILQNLQRRLSSSTLILRRRSTTMPLLRYWWFRPGKLCLYSGWWLHRPELLWWHLRVWRMLICWKRIHRRLLLVYRLGLCPHSRFDLFETHYLPRCGRARPRCADEGSILARCLCWLRAPNIGLRLYFWDKAWVLVPLVSRSLRCLDLGLAVLLCSTWLPQIVSHLLLFYGI